MDAAMKIGVLTFHRCINYGSYWQARCLVEGLRSRGHDAVLIDHDSPEIRLREWKCAFQPQLPVRTPRSLFAAYETKTRKFLEAFDALPQSPRFDMYQPEDAGEYDAVVVGSDEVWNFRHPWYASKHLFFGDGLRTQRLISYAASFGNHDAGDGIDPYWADKLRRFSAISVRDENSRTLIRNGLGIEPAMVLDPCLQFPPPSGGPRNQAAPYIALYGHGFPDWFKVALRSHADARGLRIVSIGYQNDWADAQEIEAGPLDFPALIGGASAVATNFFHGAVFGLVNGKPLVCATTPYRRNKLRDLTAGLGAERHLIDEQIDPAAFAALLDAPLDPAIAANITRMRAQSDAFLDAALG